MRRTSVACTAALIFTLALTGYASASSTEVNVRIEGRSETLFEGPVSTEPHGVRASSDKIAVGKLRRCDGINALDPENTAPGVTPTAVSADAMALIGETFDGQWYRDFEDYFVTRWGPGAQDPSIGAYWGVLVNNTFTDVGGCQYQLTPGDEVLWVDDAFHERKTLALFPEASAYTSGPRPLVIEGAGPKGGFATNEAVPVEVVAYGDNLENNPPAVPSRNGSTAMVGATVAPVLTDPAKGFELVDASAPEATQTIAGGKADVSFGTPGWHRIKATAGAPGMETVIRSNRLDICVEGGGKPLEGATECDELPRADQVRVAPPTSGEIVGPEVEPTTPRSAPSTTPAATQPTGSLRLRAPRLGTKHLAQGKASISWAVLEAGPGLKKWTISSQTVGAKHARWVTRATGTSKTSATIRLPKGAAYRLRFAVTDGLGKTSTLALGKVKVPKAGHRHGR